jgi:hypothetical protein
VRNRTEQYCRQKEEIEKLTVSTQKEEKEIRRLKELLRLTEKKDFCVQTENVEAEDRQKCYGAMEKEGSSWRKPLETSTGESELTSETTVGKTNQLNGKAVPNRGRELERERPNSTNKKQPITAVTAVSDKAKLGESRLGKSRTKDRVPLMKKYKFVPSLAFKHS